MKKILLVIDMQNDFVDGALGTKEAQMIVQPVIEKVSKFNGEVIFTRDTHEDNYLNTQEGENLPVEHCIKNTYGWQIIKPLDDFRISNSCKVYDKITFGSMELVSDIGRSYKDGEIESVTLVGLCTDICVISNALAIKAFSPELPVYIDEKCCAGVNVQRHEAALKVMNSCQILKEEQNG